MALKPSVLATLVVNKFINTSYDIVKIVSDNIAAVIRVSGLFETYGDDLDVIVDFNLRYFGPLSEAPVLDPGGEALAKGDMYFDTTLNRLRVYDSTGWQENQSFTIDSPAELSVLVYDATLEAWKNSTFVDAGIVTQGDGADTAPVSLGTADKGVSLKWMRQDAIISDILPATTTMLDGAAAITQEAGDDTTKVATTAFVKAAADAKVVETITEDVENIAPSQAVVFDALALKLDKSQIETAIVEDEEDNAPSQGAVFDALALKANLSSPAFTDEPTCPTPAMDDDSQKLANTAFIKALFEYVNVWQPKTAIDCSTDPDYPAANAGWVFPISEDGHIGGALGPAVLAGRMAVCNVDESASGDHATVGANWSILNTNLTPSTFALLAGAAFTGEVTVLDQTAGNNSTKVANTKYVDAADALKAALAGADFTGAVAIAGDGTYLGFPVMSDAAAAVVGNGKAYFSSDTNELKLGANGVYSAIGGGGAKDIITKEDHLWVEANVGMKLVQTTVEGVFTEANQDSDEDADSFFYLHRVLDEDTFEIRAAGPLTRTTAQWDVLTGDSGGMVAGTLYYLDTAAGNHLTTTRPTLGTKNDKPVCVGMSTTKAWYFDYRGVSLVDDFAAPITITYDALDENMKINWSHNMDTTNLVTSFRNAAGKVLPTEVVVDENTITLGFPGFDPEDFPVYGLGLGAGANMTYNLDTVTDPLPIGTADPGGTSGAAAAVEHVHEASAVNLQDYADGTFTPVFTSQSDPAVAVGSYTRIGNLCFFIVNIAGIGSTGGSAAALITGLPLDVASISDIIYSCNIGYIYQVNWPATALQLTARVGGGVGNTYIVLEWAQDDLAVLSATCTDFSKSLAQIMVSGWYKIAT